MPFASSPNRVRLTRRALGALLASCALLLGLNQCGTKNAAMLGDHGGDGTMTPPDVCATPNAGCPCSELGKVVDCGSVHSQIDDYVTCSMGTRTCDGNSWGSCVTDGSSTRSVGAPSRFRVQALGTSSSCTAVNPCDPYCNRFTDTPTGVDAGSGLSTRDGGLALSGTLTSATQSCTGLTITPTPQTLTVTQFSPVSPSTLTFTATFTPMGCAAAGTQPLWGIDRYDIATISTSGVLTLVTPLATTINVSAYAGTLSATAVANVNVAIVDTTTGPAPTGTSTAFTATTGTAETDLTILYPYAKTVFPLGLPSPLLQWSSATAATGSNSAVKVSIRWPVGGTGTPSFNWSAIVPENLQIYLDPPTNTVPLAAGKRRDLPQAVWSAFEQSAKGQDAELVVQRYISGTRRAELASTIHFATNQLKGTVYYQSYGTNLVQNFSTTWSPQTYGRSDRRFGAATLAIKIGQTYPTVTAGSTTATDGPGCRVCHAAAASGGSLVTNNYPNDYISSQFTSLSTTPVETLIGGTNDGKYAWPAVYKDGTFIFSNAGPPRASSTTSPGGLQGGDNGSYNSALYSIPSGTAVSGVTGIPANLKAALPVFSPDGTHIAFNHYSGGNIAPVSGSGTVAGDKHSLGMGDYNNATKTFSNFRRLVTEPSTPCSALNATDPCTDVWPTFTPNNEGVIFEREIFNNGRVSGSGHSDFGGTRSGCDDSSGSAACGNDGTKAELWWVNTSGTAVATRMNAANGLNAAGAMTIPAGASPHTSPTEAMLNYEPTMNPTATGGYYWMVFTSRRQYGNVATMNPWWSDPRFRKLGGELGPTPKKLWVAAVSSSPTSGNDPSYPAFYLPGQELLAGNSRGFWVLNACTVPSATRSTTTECETTLDCCQSPTASTCSLQTPVANPPKRHCIPLASSTCVADGATCTTHADCCNFASGSRCASGVCGAPPPITVYTTSVFTRDFSSACPSGTRPQWQLFEWQATVPTGTSINFTAKTSDTAGGLATASPVVTVANATPPTVAGWVASSSTIDASLKAAGATSLLNLRVTMTLNPSSDRLSTPSLTNWRVTYDCNPAE